jgi:prepilin-type N-terminal cleavage/methylation domain-containing protein
MKNKGFTLVEFMVVLTFMGIISVFIYQQFLLQQTGLRDQQKFSEANIKARRASEYIVSELRHIGFCKIPLSPDDQFGIIEGSINSISYTHDISYGEWGVVDDPGDIHSIEKRGDTLFLDGDRAAYFLDSLGFTYIDVNGDTIDPTETVAEVDYSPGVDAWVWVMPEPTTPGNSPGSYPINIIDYTVRFIFPDAKKKITYHEAVQIRNVRGPTLD